MLEIKQHKNTKRSAGSCKVGGSGGGHPDLRRLQAQNHTAFAIRVQRHPPGALRAGTTAHLFFFSFFLRILHSSVGAAYELEVHTSDLNRRTENASVVTSEKNKRQSQTHLGCEFSSYMRSLPSLNKLMVCLVFLVRFSMKTRKYSLSPRVSILPS